jgi:division protein CdvB (Snf7/Vps24/ESCRT-III family)
MKLYISLLFTFAFFLIACADKPKTNQSSAEVNAIIEKNKQTSLLNEVSAITRTAQRLEGYGREMDSYRRAPDAARQETCNKLMTDGKQDLTELETKINNLPENYKIQLTSITSDLNACVSCSKKAMESCKKARASINDYIKQTFPQ